MLTLLKLGGSVITDKQGQEVADLPLIRRLAGEIQAALAANPDLNLVVGHGSGSFGHVYAHRYGVHKGLAADANWLGFALTGAAALRLNRIVVDELLAAGVPALSVQPMAGLRVRGGRLVAWETGPVLLALQHGLVPVVHGDVAFDEQQGSAIISTEQLLSHLARSTTPVRLVLVGVDAVYTADPRRDPQATPIPLISQANIEQVLAGAGESHGVDVTGGMRDKVQELWSLATLLPGLQAHLIGTSPGILQRALLGQAEGEGTVIRA